MTVVLLTEKLNILPTKKTPQFWGVRAVTIILKFYVKIAVVELFKCRSERRRTIGYKAVDKLL